MIPKHLKMKKNILNKYFLVDESSNEQFDQREILDTLLEDLEIHLKTGRVHRGFLLAFFPSTFFNAANLVLVKLRFTAVPPSGTSN